MTKSEGLKNNKSTSSRGASVVGRLGFEPGMTEPKPVVLPLHHRPIPCFAAAKVVKIWRTAKFLATYLY